MRFGKEDSTVSEAEVEKILNRERIEGMTAVKAFHISELHPESTPDDNWQEAEKREKRKIKIILAKR